MTPCRMALALNAVVRALLAASEALSAEAEAKPVTR